MRSFALLTAALCSLVLMGAGAQARVAVDVDIATQTMRVSSMAGDYVWPISSARAGFHTPRGSFGVQSMAAVHRSRKYNNAPMPHAVFFTGGYAIHGTGATRALGAPASHGCIRLAPGNAAALFRMVKAEGAQITIRDRSPTDTRYARAGQPRAARIVAVARSDIARGWALRRGGIDPSDQLGYAPVVAPGFDRWMDDPAAY